MYLMGAPPRINPVNMDQQHQEVLVIETDDPVLLHLVLEPDLPPDISLWHLRANQGRRSVSSDIWMIETDDPVLLHLAPEPALPPGISLWHLRANWERRSVSSDIWWWRGPGWHHRCLHPSSYLEWNLHVLGSGQVATLTLFFSSANKTFIVYGASRRDQGQPLHHGTTTYSVSNCEII